jgi:hypothetical protein
MRLDELCEDVVRPQQDKEVKILINGELKEPKVVVYHESGYFVLTPKEEK